MIGSKFTSGLKPSEELFAAIHLENLNFHDQYTATITGRESDTVVAQVSPTKVCITSRGKFELYKRDSSFEGFDPRIWNDVIHFGSIFARRSQFVEIGGYSEVFLHWGYEDVDTQWKLKGKYIPCELKEVDDLEVIHLNHPKAYYNGEISDKNRKIHERRIALGLEDAIKYDKNHNGVVI